MTDMHHIGDKRMDRYHELGQVLKLCLLLRLIGVPDERPIKMPRRLCSACQSTALRGHITEAWASSIASPGHICEDFPGVRLQTWSAILSQSIIL